MTLEREPRKPKRRGQKPGSPSSPGAPARRWCGSGCGRRWPPRARWRCCSWRVSWAGLMASAAGLARARSGSRCSRSASLAALAPLVRSRSPTRAAALRRLDRDSPAAHAPATASRTSSPMAWRMKRRARFGRCIGARVAAETRKARRPRRPSPGMAWRDPRAFRYAALLLAAAAFLSAGAQRGARLAAAFDFRGSCDRRGRRPGRRLDRSARLYRPAADPAQGRRPDRARNAFRRPRIRKSSCAPRPRITTAPRPARSWRLPAAGQAAVDRRAALHVSRATASSASRAAARRSRPSRSTPFPPGKPTIELIDPPKANASGSLALHYRIGDAYGVASAEATFEFARGRQAPARRAAALRPLAAQFAGRRRRGAHDRRSLRAPLGGRRSDDAAQRRPTSPAASAQSDPVKLKLPQRVFINPLAKRAGRNPAQADPRSRRDARQGAAASSPRCGSRPISSARRRASISASAPRMRGSTRAPNDADAARRRRSAVGDGAADRGRRRLADPEGSARRRAEAAGRVEERRERRGNPRAHQAAARTRRPLHARDGGERQARAPTATSRPTPKISTT